VVATTGDRRNGLFRRRAVVSTPYTRHERVMKGAVLCSQAMAKGTVDFFNDTGGYGFIETEDADEDVFFHMEDVGGPDLEEGQELEFDIEQAEKGPRATNVTRL
jgi:CspA family cold shock protein